MSYKIMNMLYILSTDLDHTLLFSYISYLIVYISYLIVHSSSYVGQLPKHIFQTLVFTLQ